MADSPTGRFCWHELMTTDPGAAPNFYAAVTGWGTQGWEGGSTYYTMWMNGDAPIGGIMELPEEARKGGAPSHWLAYVSTTSIEETTERATELGGTVLHGPMELPEVGTITVLQDPQGAVFCAYQPATYTPGHDGAPAMGEFSWHELATNNWEAAWTFYSELFGWQKGDALDLGEMGTYQMYHRGAHPLGGMFNKPPDMPAPCWLLYVRVPDVAAAANQVTAMGGTVVSGPMEVPGGDLVAQCADPQGALFALHQTAPT